jgi:glycosyltransferase involved in cell wall biosynthesis
MTPLVSVIIPYRDRTQWLGQAIDSVLAQTFADLELLVVDDGSREPADLGPAANDPRVRHIHQPPTGAAAARNRGLDESRGRYVAFLDSDDLFRPDKLAVQVAAMEAQPSAVLSHTSYERIDAGGGPCGAVRSGWWSGDVHALFGAGCPVATPTVVIRRSALGKERFEESLRVAEDLHLWLRLAALGPVLGIDRPLAQVRMHGSNAAMDRRAQRIARRVAVAHARTVGGSMRFVTSGRTPQARFIRAACVYAKKRRAIISLACLWWARPSLRRAFARWSSR